MELNLIMGNKISFPLFLTWKYAALKKNPGICNILLTLLELMPVVTGWTANKTEILSFSFSWFLDGKKSLGKTT